MTERVNMSAGKEGAPHMPSWMDEEAVTYEQAGVDIFEGERAVEAIRGIVHETYDENCIGDLGSFGCFYSIDAAKQMEDPVLVSGTDGVGTKLKIAQIVGKNDTVGIDLVAMCVNDVVASGAQPLFFLDYVAIGKLKADTIAEIVGGIADGCKQAGCALIGGEMAEHPGVMEVGDYDLAGFCVGLIDRPRMLRPADVREGDLLIGIASSGLHSNGYSLVRKVCVEGKTHYELRIPRDELEGRSLQEALLEPTRIYVRPVQETMNKVPGGIRSMANITGGGITENLNRALNDQVNAQVDLGTWPVPSVIAYVCRAAHLNEEQELRTFNMGLGMIAIVDPDKADAVEAALQAAGETTYRVGRIVKGSGVVEYTNNGGLYSYEG